MTTQLHVALHEEVFSSPLIYESHGFTFSGIHFSLLPLSHCNGEDLGVGRMRSKHIAVFVVIFSLYAYIYLNHFFMIVFVVH